MAYQKVKPAIVIPAFQRSESLKLLLSSINSARYPRSDIVLIISLEHEADPGVVKIAEEFNFSSGYKKVVFHKKKKGLKEHIFECANYSDE